MWWVLNPVTRVLKIERRGVDTKTEERIMGRQKQSWSYGSTGKECLKPLNLQEARKGSSPELLEGSMALLTL